MNQLFKTAIIKYGATFVIAALGWYAESAFAGVSILVAYTAGYFQSAAISNERCKRKDGV